MAVQFLRVGVVAIGSLTSAPDSNAHSGEEAATAAPCFTVGGIPAGFRGPKGGIL